MKQVVRLLAQGFYQKIFVKLDNLRVLMGFPDDQIHILPVD
jgi:hypothetical protein